MIRFNLSFSKIQIKWTKTKHWRLLYWFNWGVRNSEWCICDKPSTSLRSSSVFCRTNCWGVSASRACGSKPPPLPINYLLHSVSCRTRGNMSTPQDPTVHTHESLAIQTEENLWQHKLLGGTRWRHRTCIKPCLLSETGDRETKEPGKETDGGSRT